MTVNSQIIILSLQCKHFGRKGRGPDDKNISLNISFTAAVDETLSKEYLLSRHGPIAWKLYIAIIKIPCLKASRIILFYPFNLITVRHHDFVDRVNLLGRN